MGCLELTITPFDPAAMTVAATPGASLAVRQVGQPSLVVGQPSQASLALDVQKVSLEVTPVGGAELTLGEVCSTTDGTLVVLAGSDGPFRTRDGGYFLLDPERSPATRSRSRRSK